MSYVVPSIVALTASAVMSGIGAPTTLVVAEVAVSSLVETLLSASSTSRRRVHIRNMSAADSIAIGPTGVTFASGYVLVPVGTVGQNEITLEETGAIYAISNGVKSVAAVAEEVL